MTMSRWEREREESLARLQTRDEHLDAAAGSKESMLRDIGNELTRKGIGEKKESSE